MTNPHIVEFLQIVANQPDLADFEGPREERLVARAEAAIGHRFPSSYREFLLALGAGDFDGEEFYGVISDDFVNSGIPDAVWLTLRERVDSSLPNSYLIVGDAVEGGYYVLDLEMAAAGAESPVEIWIPGKGITAIIAADFGAFALARIADGSE
jgi:hypothetical protein